MSEFDDLDAVLDRLEAESRIDARIDALRREALAHLARRPSDVPLHQRGFGVMDEPPA